MIVVMKKDASQADVDHIIDRIHKLGLKPHVITGTERTVIAVVGDDRKTYKESLESGSGVAEVLPILAPYKMASRELRAEPTVIKAGSLVVGGDTRIHDNRAAYGAVEVFGTAVFKERTRIDHNTATREGGGLFVGDDGSHSGNVTLKGHARIDDNTVTPAVGKGQGGGVYLGDASLTLTGSARIDHNTAAADGGGIFLLHPLAASVLTGAICGLNVRKNTPDQIGPSCPKVITP